MNVDLNIKGDIEVLRLQPGDVIVVSLEDRVSPDAIRQMSNEVKKRFPDHEVIFTQGATLTVQRESSVG